MKILEKLVLLFIMLLFQLHCFSQRKAFESYYLRTKDYPPFDAAPSWAEAFNEVQGVTHDDNNWYITSVGATQVTKIINGIPTLVAYVDCFLWKIPVDEKLDQDFTPNTKVKSIHLLQFPKLANPDSLNGYIHWGDLDRFKYKGVYYLIIPVTSPELPSPAIIIIKATDLSLIGYGQLPGEPDHPQKDIGWCAIAPDSSLITSNDDTNTLLKYSLDWEAISKMKGKVFSNDVINFRHKYQLQIKDRYGHYATLYNMQGGEFSPSGELLYLSNGSGKCKGIGPGFHGNDGIHVFDTTTWAEIQHSTNHDLDQKGYFDYHYDPSCGILETNAHSAEGLTIWDLDNGKAPFVDGQLHVLVSRVGLSNNRGCMEHFTGKIHVDELNGLPAIWNNWTNVLPGTNDRPFFTVNDAFNWFPVWDGAQIVVKNGFYLDADKYKKRVKITSQNGNAIIGTAKTSIKGTVLYEHVGYNGDYKYFDSDIPDLDFGTSSVRIYNVKQVTVYDGENYTGSSFTINNNIENLVTYDWNDRIRSLKIIK